MPFTFEKTPLAGVVVVAPRVFPDGRGFFMETYKRSEFAKAGIDVEFIQDNHSSSSKGVVRGLHYQKAPHAQGKLVRASRGAIFDVVVDMRSRFAHVSANGSGSSCPRKAGKCFTSPLASRMASPRCPTMSSFSTKSPPSTASAAEAGIAWDDPTVGVRWPVANPTSLREGRHPAAAGACADNNFVYQG